jgi:hypothetical protein
VSRATRTAPPQQVQPVRPDRRDGPPPEGRRRTPQPPQRPVTLAEPSACPLSCGNPLGSSVNRELVSNAIAACGVTEHRPVHGPLYSDVKFIGIRLLDLGHSIVIEVRDTSYNHPNSLNRRWTRSTGAGCNWSMRSVSAGATTAYASAARSSGANWLSTLMSLRGTQTAGPAGQTAPAPPCGSLSWQQQPPLFQLLSQAHDLGAAAPFHSNLPSPPRLTKSGPNW